MIEYPSEMPKEPTGLGAVIEVESLIENARFYKGEKFTYVRIDGEWLINGEIDRTGWSCIDWYCIQHRADRGYATFPRVLSEGVQR